MWEDTLVEEVHAIRDQLLARFDGDLHQYCEYVRSLGALGTTVAAASVVASAVPHGFVPVGVHAGVKAG